jgi:hypothetical protein
MPLTAPRFTTRVPIQFIVPDKPSLSITAANGNLIQNNPAIFNVNNGTVAQTSQGSDGLNYFRGDGEYAPFTLEIDWNWLSYSDYLNLAALRPYYVHFISYRNVGYYGKLVCDSPQSAGIKVQDVVTLQAQFYALSPSDEGGAVSCERLSTPSALSVENSEAATGFIPSVTTQYYWLTFSTRYGETLPQPAESNGFNSGTNNTSNSIAWTWPTYSAYIEKASIYVSQANDPTTSRLLADVPYGLSPLWIDYVGFQGSLVNQQPPTVNTAFCGQWTGGIWTNEVFDLE